jgi:hypothetical protein
MMAIVTADWSDDGWVWLSAKDNHQRKRWFKGKFLAAATTAS